MSDNGLVVAKDYGKTIITCSCGEISASCEVKVAYLEPDSIELNINKVQLNVGETLDIIAKVYPVELSQTAVVPIFTWRSSDPEVASIKGDYSFKYYGLNELPGIITALSEGITTVSVSCEGYSASCEVVVVDTSGVHNIFTNSNSIVDIYSIEGKLIKKQASIEDVKLLSKGIYIY